MDLTGSSIDSLDSQAIDALPVAVCVCNHEGRLLRVNQRARDLWGHTPTIDDLNQVGFCPRAGGLVRDAAFVVRRRDGSNTPVRVTTTPITDASGSTVAVLGTFMEDRIDSDADLHRAQLAAIVVSSDDAIVGKTLDGVITSWNVGAERVFGYSAEEAIGKHISLIIPADRLDEEIDVLARLRRGEKIDHFETVRRAKDGHLVDISLTVSPIMSSDGRIIGASKVARDISERRLAHEALSRSRRRYQRIFESAGVSIWDEDFTAIRAGLDELRASGVRDFAAYFRERPEEVDRYIGLLRIVDVNETTLRMFGASDKRQLLQSFTAIFTEQTSEDFARVLVALAEGRTHFQAETVLRTLHDERIDALLSITFPTPDEPADSVLVTLTDITLQKQAEQTLRNSDVLFHEMADTAPAMLWMSDASGAWTFLSRQWYDLTTQTAESALGLGWLDAIHVDDRDSAADTVVEATRQRRQFHFECRLAQPHGELPLGHHCRPATVQRRRRVSRFRRQRDRHHRTAQGRRSGHRRNPHAGNAVACWRRAGLGARSRPVDSGRDRRSHDTDDRTVGLILLQRCRRSRGRSALCCRRRGERLVRQFGQRVVRYRCPRLLDDPHRRPSGRRHL